MDKRLGISCLVKAVNGYWMIGDGQERLAE